MAATVSPIANIQLLNHHNYEDWSFRVKVYLLAEDVWDVVEATTEPPKREDGEAEFRAWRKNNAKALLTIQMCCGDDTYYLIKGITTAKAAWDALAEEQKPSDDDEGINPSDDDEGINPPDVDEGRRNNNGESDVKYESLYDSLKCGDWNAAKEFISQHPESLTHRGSSKGGTALHEAIESKRLNIVENLLQLMSGEDLEIEDRRGCTAFYYALTKGVAKIVASMVEKNSNLVTMRFTNKEGKTPVVFAHTLERYEIARFLYSHTPSQVLTEDKNGQDGADLLCQCIFYRNFFDSGWDLLQHNPKLGLTQGYFMGISPLYELAASRWAFPSGVSLRFWQRWIYKSINVQPQPAPTNSVDVRLNFEIKLEDDDKRNQWDLISSVTGFFQGIVKNLQKLLGIHGLYEMKLRHERCFEFLKCMSSEVKINKS